MLTNMLTVASLPSASLRWTSLRWTSLRWTSLRCNRLRCIGLLGAGLVVLAAFAPAAASAESVKLSPGVRGVATRAPIEMKIDGDLSEFKDAFATPVEYFHADLKNRAAQFFYMWDDEAFYAALRTLDQHQADNADDDHLWEGDAVEWYFDTRRGADFRNIACPTDPVGAVHCYWTGYKNDQLQPRFCL